MAEGVYPNGMPHPPGSLRARMALELGVLAVLTAVFVRYAPKDIGLQVGMALIGLGLIGFTAGETRVRIWGPPASPEFDRVRRCFTYMTALTIPPIFLFLIIGIVGRYVGVWWLHDATPMLNFNFLIALALYLPWALLQQTLFQFYLLGRLRALLPFASPLLLSILNGIAYGLVHIGASWPEMAVTAVTIIGGIFWSYSYHRDRYVLPIAISHALLASTFYYWVVGRDLVEEFVKRLATP